MGQVFRPRANAIYRTVLAAAVLGLLLVAGGAVVTVHSGAIFGVGRAVVQPVPFSHEHHVAGLGIGCQYCHSSVERSAFAGLPATETCMTCHSQLWTNAEMLAPVRQSLAQNRPIRWRRVHDLADFVYFDHSAHLANGVGCESCHGRVDRMALIRKEKPLSMEWCLECHRAPERFVRPERAIYEMGWQPPEGTDRLALGRRLVAEYGIHTKQLTDCSVCHR